MEPGIPTKNPLCRRYAYWAPVACPPVKITRVCGEQDRSLMFRGWSRLCLHAASLSAAEGASASATAIARAARAEAMETEAQAAADKAEAWRRAVAASAEVAEAREKAEQLSMGVSALTAELKQRADDSGHLMREQQLRRMKRLVSNPLCCAAPN